MPKTLPIAERLRATPAGYPDGQRSVLFNPDGLEAADTIEGLVEAFDNARDNHRTFVVVAESRLNALQKEHDRFYRDAVAKFPELKADLMGYQHRVSSTIAGGLRSCRLAKEALRKRALAKIGGEA